MYEIVMAQPLSRYSTAISFPQQHQVLHLLVLETMILYSLQSIIGTGLIFVLYSQECCLLSCSCYSLQRSVVDSSCAGQSMVTGGTDFTQPYVSSMHLLGTVNTNQEQYKLIFNVLCSVISFIPLLQDFCLVAKSDSALTNLQSLAECKLIFFPLFC